MVRIFGRKKKDELPPEGDRLDEDQKSKLEEQLLETQRKIKEAEDKDREEEAQGINAKDDDLNTVTTLVEAKRQLLKVDLARQAKTLEADKKQAQIQSELAAIAKYARGGFIVAVITTRLPGGRRKSIAIVNVDITGKPVPKSKKLYGQKKVGLDEGLLFSVNGRQYELDSEYISWEIPQPTIFYDRDKTEPIHFYERTVNWKGKMISTIDMLGHFSLRIEKLINQKIVEIAARERPEEVKQPFTRMVVAMIAVMAFLLGILLGKFGF